MSWMYEEILSQPSAVRETLLSLEKRADDVRTFLNEKSIQRVLFIARGSSDSAAMYGQYLFGYRNGLLTASASPSLATAYQADIDLVGTLAIAISQSGETAEIIDTLHWAKERGATTLAITNTPGSSMETVADITLNTMAGIERAVPATKSYTTALAVLAHLSLAMKYEIELAKALSALPMAMERQLNRNLDLTPAIGAMFNATSAAVTGRGFTLTIAHEIALKLQETCAVIAIGLSAADLQHGPMGAISVDCPVIAFTVSPTSPMSDGLTHVVEKAMQRGGSVITIGPTQTATQIHIMTEDVLEPLLPFVACLPAQLLVEHLAISRGVNPDSPGGLTKVTQTVP